MCSDYTAAGAGVPQGSVLGPLLFIAYISPVERLIHSYGIKYVAYADDIALYLNFTINDIALHECLSSLGNWLLFNNLLLNVDKSQCMVVGTRQQVKLNPKLEIKIDSENIPQSQDNKLLGVILDPNLNFNKQTSSICSAANYHIRALKHIRNCISTKTANTIACTLISSKLDYCNALLANTSDHNLDRLQRVQNLAARIVTKRTRYESSSKILADLHWLPVRQRIDYKISLLTFKTLVNSKPSYLNDLLRVSMPTRSLRSSSNGLLLDIPFCKTETIGRAFMSTAPKIWNKLPQDLRILALPERNSDPSAILYFKKSLKCFMYKSAFDCSV